MKYAPCTGYAYPLYLKGNRSALADINPLIPAPAKPKRHATRISRPCHQGRLAREEDRMIQTVILVSTRRCSRSHMSVKNTCRSDFMFSDRQSRPLYPSPTNGSLRKRDSPPLSSISSNTQRHPRKRGAGICWKPRSTTAVRLLLRCSRSEKLTREAGHQKGQPIRLAFLFLFLHLRSASPAHGSARYMGWIDQLFGTSPSFFHCFNVFERTYSVPVVPTAVFCNH